MKQCKQGYYYCNTDKKCKRIPLGYRVASSGYLRKENGDDQTDSDNDNGETTNGDGGGMSESTILEKLDGKSAKDKGYSLRDWFKGGGWKQAGGKYDGKPCAKQPGQTTKPYCRDPDDRDAMSEDERDKRAAKKRKEDPNPDRKGKAKIVTQKNSFEPEGNLVDEGKKDACYKKVKASAKVWPSAYASGRLVQCRKKGAANYGNKSESVEFSNWRDDFQATEYEFIDIIKAEPLISEGVMPAAIDPKAHKKAQKRQKVRNMTKSPNKNEANVAREMSKGPSLPMEEVDRRRAPAELVARLRSKTPGLMADDGPNKPSYDAKQRLLAKTNAKRMKEQVESIDELKCWKGYKRKKGSVPGAKGSCVKENEEVIEAKDETEIGITGKRIPKTNWRSPKKRHEFEKKRREAGFTSTGPKYKKSDVSPYYNPLQKNHVELEGEKIEEKKEESKVGGGNLKTLTKKAVKRIDYDVDGDVDPNDKVEKKTGDYGEELPTPFGKFKTKIKKEEFSDWRDELDEGWKSALAGAGVAAALMSQGGQKAPDKKTTTSPSRSNTERVSKTTQKKLSPMDQWRKNYPGLAKKSDNPPKFNRKKLSPINKDWEKANPKLAEKEKDNRSKLREAIDKSKMKCNSPKSQAVGDSQTGKSHVVKACEGGKEKIIRFGQRGVKGSPKKEGESKEYASRRNRFKTRHAKNISKGKMSAAYWSNKVKW